MELTLLLKIFSIGSSFLPTLFTLIYLGIKNNKKKIIKNYEIVIPIILVIFGLFTVLAYYLYKVVKKSMKFYIFSLVGGLLGLSLGFMGDYLDLPIKLFNFTKNNKHYFYPISTVLYSGLFQFIVQPYLFALL